MTFAQFDPPAGQPGSFAMKKDSTAFVAWATKCKIKRGYQNIAAPSSGYASIGDSSSATGKADGVKVVSLGDAGEAILTFAAPIKDGPGNDFAVFENGFNDTFLELAFVEVSSDGINYFRFPAVSNTPDTLQMGNDASIDARHLKNLAGKYRSGYGTPFDLQELAGLSGLDINHIIYVKIIDVVGSMNSSYATVDKNGKRVNDPWPTPFASSGFDLDAVGVVYQQTPESVEELETAIQLDIYPNPITQTSVVQIVLNTPQVLSIDVIDITGRQMAVVEEKMVVQKSNTLLLNSLNLKDGIYFLRVVTGTSSVTKKIMIANE